MYCGSSVSVVYAPARQRQQAQKLASTEHIRDLRALCQLNIRLLAQLFILSEAFPDQFLIHPYIHCITIY